MNTDIRIKLGQPDHRKTQKLVKMAGEGAYRCLIRLWAAIARDHPSGDSSMTAEDIELDAGWRGKKGRFANALNECGYMDVTKKNAQPPKWIPHDWNEHQQWVVGAAERSKRARLNATTGWQTRKGASIKPASSQHQATGMQPSDSGNAPILSSPILTKPNTKTSELTKWVFDFLASKNSPAPLSFIEANQNLNSIKQQHGDSTPPFEECIKLIYQECWSEKADKFMQSWRANLNNNQALRRLSKNWPMMVERAIQQSSAEDAVKKYEELERRALSGELD